MLHVLKQYQIYISYWEIGVYVVLLIQYCCSVSYLLIVPSVDWHCKSPQKRRRHFCTVALTRKNNVYIASRIHPVQSIWLLV
jgi:hypothetical protein